MGALVIGLVKGGGEVGGGGVEAVAAFSASDGGIPDGGDVWIFGREGGERGTCVGVVPVEDDDGLTGAAGRGGRDRGDAAFARRAGGGAALPASLGNTGGRGSLMVGFVLSGRGILVFDRNRL